MTADVATRRPQAADKKKRQAAPRKPFHAQYPPWKAPERPAQPATKWFSDEEFEELELLCGVSLVEDVRLSINDLVDLIANWTDDRPSRKPHKKKQEQLVKLRKSFATTRRDLRAVEKSSIPGRSQSLLELWRATLAPDMPLPTEYYDLWPLAERLFASLDGVAAEQIDNLRRNPRGAPKQFQHLDTFIAFLATSYARSGGVPSATYKTSTRHRNRGEAVRETPFLRMLRFVHARLPRGRQATSMAALEERADRVIADLKTWRTQMNFPSWCEQGQKSAVLQR